MRGGNTTLIDLTGRTFGRLKVIGRAPDNKYYNTPRPMWLCECECGNKTVVMGANLRDGKTRSCGCLRRETSAENGRRRKGTQCKS